MLRDLVIKNRSYRRFDAGVSIPLETLKELVDLARMSPSAANLQPLKFFLSCTPELNQRIFPFLIWAGYLTDWSGPQEHERPGAYIVILGDTQIARAFGFDPGIAAQTILLGAVEKGLGGCMIGTFKKNELRAALELEERFDILLVLALGQPVESVTLEDLPAGASVRYWRNAESGHHVPKRSLDEIIL